MNRIALVEDHERLATLVRKAGTASPVAQASFHLHDGLVSGVLRGV